MKRLLIIICIMLIYCGCSTQSKSPPIDSLILSGKGYNNLVIGESNIYDVISKYGNHYKFENGITDMKDGSAIHQYRYDYQTLGIEFESDVKEPQSEDPRDYILKSISFRHPFDGVTKENIKLNETKKNELIKVLGDNYKSLKTYKGFERLIYNKLGISFNINRETDIIEKISIFKPYN